MSKVVWANLYELGELTAAKWRDGNNESYEETQKMAARSAQRGDLLVIGRMDKLENVTPRMICRVANDYGQGIWRDVSVGEMTIATALEKNQESPKDVAAQVIGARAGVNNKWEPWNQTHNEILQVLAVLRDLLGSAGDKEFMQLAEAHNENCERECNA